MLSIRIAEQHDIPIIRELTYAVWPQTYSNIISQQQIDYMLELMYSPSSLQKQMNENGCSFIIASENEIPVGFASYQKLNTGTWKLDKLYVLSSQQGKGTGKFIINYIVSELKKINAPALRLQVNRHNNAKSFYEKIGFKIIGTADFDIGNGYFMNDYVMELTL